MNARRPACVAVALLLAACGGQPPAPPGTDTDASAALPRLFGGGCAPDAACASAFAQAVPPARLDFPRDHGPHPDHRIEWWYLTSNLRAADGRRFGTEFALFRVALRPGEPALRPAWDSSQLFLVHAALSELTDGRFHFLERAARPALGQAGASALPFRAWVGACEAVAQPGAAAPPGGTTADTLLPLRVRCGDQRFGYDLLLTATRGKVLHGEDGYSEKSATPGSASYYYSYPFLHAEGTLRSAGQQVRVSGSAWFDHEWGSAVLAPGQSGWDWFSLRLDDGSALMLFRIRDAQQRAVAVRGTLVRPDGTVQPFADGTVVAQPRRWWTSPTSGVAWPVGWTLRAPALGLQLEVETALDAQELQASVRYWEGAISARGTRAGAAVSAEGYLELTGYPPPAAAQQTGR